MVYLKMNGQPTSNIHFELCECSVQYMYYIFESLLQSDILAEAQGPVFAYCVGLLGNKGSIVYQTFQGGW